MIKKVEKLADVPCTTTATSDINESAVNYFESSGLNITNLTGLGLMNDYEISEVDRKTTYQMAMDLSTPDTDAVFISCTGTCHCTTYSTTRRRLTSACTSIKSSYILACFMTSRY